MPAILEADAVWVGGEPVVGPISLTVGRGEIVGLLFAEGVPHEALLRTLAGLNPPRRGAVRFNGAPRVSLAVGAESTIDAFNDRPDLVVFDGLVDIEGRAERDAWTRIASERERGTAIVVATVSVEQAYRSDRVALAMWGSVDFTRELRRLALRMHDLITEAMDGLSMTSIDHIRTRRIGELQRLTHASRHLLGEARSCMRSPDDLVRVEEAAAELASVSLDDRVLESLVAKADYD
jgi:ABC-type cobalamin/Fe3+-siderophores transport system ATPase subunit